MWIGLGSSFFFFFVCFFPVPPVIFGASQASKPAAIQCSLLGVCSFELLCFYVFSYVGDYYMSSTLRFRLVIPETWLLGTELVFVLIVDNRCHVMLINLILIIYIWIDWGIYKFIKCVLHISFDHVSLVNMCKYSRSSDLFNKHK